MVSLVIPAGNKKKIHVNGHHIRSNQKNPEDAPLPVYTIKYYEDGKRKNVCCHRWEADGIEGINSFTCDPAALGCGATVWLETRGEVRILDAA